MIHLSPDDVSCASALLRAIERELWGIVVTSGQGDSFVFYDPDHVTKPDSRFPFLTLVTGNRYDAASDLDRDVHRYRINLSVDRQTYESLLGPAPRQAAGYEVIDAGADYTDVDLVLPHPFYSPMHWVCIVNPAEVTRSQLPRLLESSHALAKRQHDNQFGR